MTNILAMSPWELESDPQYPHKMPGAGLSFGNPNSVKPETEASRSSLSSLASQTGEVQIQ